MRRHSLKTVTLAACAGLVLAIAPVAAANAVVTHTGTRICTGAKLPLLTIDAKNAGVGNWVNYYNPADGRAWSFPGGYSQQTSAFQATTWQVSNSLGFYSTPGAGCF